MSRTSLILNMFSLHKKLIVRAANIGARNLFTSRVLRKNLYETLGLSRDATQADIKNAYFELSKLYHPDRIAATDENLAKFREVSAAYEILGNEHSRKLYDQGLIGEHKRLPVEDTEEISDPIIKFYKKRMEEKAINKKDELDAWTRTYFAEAKKKAGKKHQLFQKSERPTKLVNDFTEFWFEFLVIFIVVTMCTTGLQDSKTNRFFKKVSSCLSK